MCLSFVLEMLFVFQMKLWYSGACPIRLARFDAASSSLGLIYLPIHNRDNGFGAVWKPDFTLFQVLLNNRFRHVSVTRIWTEPSRHRPFVLVDFAAGEPSQRIG